MPISLALVLGDNLFHGLPGIPEDTPIWMMEDLGLCTRVRHHQQKLVLFLSGMRHFARDCGRPVHYHRLEDQTHRTLLTALNAWITEHQIERLYAYEPHDEFFRAALIGAIEIELVLLPSPMFLTSANDWAEYENGSKRLLMGDFYIQQRRRMNILMDGSQPRGEKWSFDEENRKKLPKTVVPPEIWAARPDEITNSVIQLVQQRFSDHPGNASEFAYAVDRAGALEWLDQFLTERLAQFGPYEDALTTRHRTVFHSVLTPMMNTGLLTPSEIVERTLRHAQTNDVPLASLEGFIRQIIGWREFIFHVSKKYDAHSLPNHFGHHRKLNYDAWWNGHTGLPPLDLTIQRAWSHGYAHHIERLMVVGSAMLMAGVHPEESYRWFMEMFVDSADWVMLPNVIGMSQFADGGLFATKPYISGSSYLLKMGDYPPGPWTEIWDGLYWGFIGKHQEEFARNHRMSMMVSAYERLAPVRRNRILNSADTWVKSVSH